MAGYYEASDYDASRALAQSPTTESSKNGSSNNSQIVKIVASTIGGVCAVLIILLVLIYLKRRKIKRSKTGITDSQERTETFLLHDKVILPNKRDYHGETNMDELELPLLGFATLAKATNNFSDENKLGQGGFGCVYKGTLTEGEVVAIKRLSTLSDQGIEELKNEVRLIAKLQHRNLVRVLGCCIEVEEKLLVYEFMENKSLNTLLFEKDISVKLNWNIRFQIICGITRGLLYLHQDSRFKIIHRDLKASNILLDKEMNPKISDFGMARIFGKDQTEAETKKVVGTYGYMSPEYAMDGSYSTKSDVFSFGVLVLEIVSGNKNRGSSYTSSQLSLLGHTWMLWREGNPLELVDETLGEKFSKDEVLRCIQIGLLCVQEQPEDRPTYFRRSNFCVVRASRRLRSKTFFAFMNWISQQKSAPGKIWASAIKLALQARNKFAFVDGSCVKSAYVTSNVLSAEWDIFNVVVLTWIINSVSFDVYMGLVYSVNATSVWKELESTYDKVDAFVTFNLLQKISSIKQACSLVDYSLLREFDALTKLPTCTCDANEELDLHNKLMKDPLLEVKDVYTTVSREESHREIHESSNVTKSKLNHTSFAAKSFNVNKRSNNASNYRGSTTFNNNRGPNPNLLCKNCSMIGHTIERCYELIGYPPGFKKVSNLVKQSSLNKTIMKTASMRIPLEAFMPIWQHVGNLKLTRNIVLYDVLVVLGYYDLKRETVFGISSESGGLYLFNMTNDKFVGMSNMVMSFNVSKDLWHSRLGHPANQVYQVLLHLSESVNVTPCKICHRAKQSREPFPLSDHKSEKLGELIHLDLWGLYKVYSRKGLKYFLTIVDDFSKAVWAVMFCLRRRASSILDGSGSSSRTDTASQYSEGNTTTQVDDNSSYEGNVPSILNVFPNQPAHTVDIDRDQPSIKRSSRPSKLLAKLNDYVIDSKLRYGIEKHVNYANLNYVNYSFTTTLNKSVDHVTYYDVIKDNNSIEAMNIEIEALNRNNTWIVTDLPAGRKAIGYKWLYKIKYKASDETFSHVLDVNNAFLYGDLSEEVYMTLPLGFDSSSHNQVCKLNKSLYGLKEAPRKWNAKLTTALVKHGFEQRKHDYSLYIKQSENMFIALLVYVNDIVITGNSKKEIDDFKTFLRSKFMIKDLGVLKYFLGIEILENNSGICMSQRKYCLELLHEFGLLAAKPVTTPLPENCVFAINETKNDKFLNNICEYQKLLGKLIYLTHTRLDMSYVVHCRSQHMHSPLQSN
ncbi:receptor-like serine/threonine-protein kinase SD1-8 [Tanacetum coccineum]